MEATLVNAGNARDYVVEISGQRRATAAGGG